jgi:hypothetical protein
MTGNMPIRFSTIMPRKVKAVIQVAAFEALGTHDSVTWFRMG